MEDEDRSLLARGDENVRLSWSGWCRRRLGGRSRDHDGSLPIRCARDEGRRLLHFCRRRFQGSNGHAGSSHDEGKGHNESQRQPCGARPNKTHSVARRDLGQSLPDASGELRRDLHRELRFELALELQDDRSKTLELGAAAHTSLEVSGQLGPPARRQPPLRSAPLGPVCNPLGVDLIFTMVSTTYRHTIAGM